MSYKPLKITFYENRNEFEEEYNSRFNFFLLLRLDLKFILLIESNVSQQKVMNYFTYHYWNMKT